MTSLPLFSTIYTTPADRASMWIEKHPAAYAKFCEVALDMVRAGAKSIGAKDVAEAIRRHSRLVKQPSDQYKINNTYVSAMARKAAAEYPELADVFEFRGGK